jgi:hypothetical protein
MRRRLTAVLAAISVFAMAGTALAVTVAPDTFTEGYDPTNHVLVWSASKGVIVTCTAYSFTVDTTGEISALNPALAGCGLNAISVEGPNGQVNHGMVVSSFRRALREAGISGGGCMSRFIAQSSYGQGVQQVQVTTTVSTAPTVTVAPTVTTLLQGTANLATHQVTCGHGKPETAGQGQASANSHGGGRPEWAGTGHGPNG